MRSPRMAAAVLLAGACMTAPGALEAQEPPDSVRVDSLAADTVTADSLAAADSLALGADTVLLDSLAVDTLPRFARGAAPASRAGVWEWSGEELRWAPGRTLADLLAEVPGIWTLRGGDYGAPVGAVAFGAAAGRVRVRIDGVDWTPFEASLSELSQVPMAGVERVRVKRSLAGIDIDLETLTPDDARAFSLIEVGTGDLDTNVFRGTFLLPGALGGLLGGALERVDTRGPQGDEPGALTSVWVRYSAMRGRRGGVEFDLRRRGIERTLFEPAELTRTDWTVRGRLRLHDRVVLGAHWSESGLEGRVPAVGDTTQAPGVRQIGADLSARTDAVWARAGGRWFDQAGLPGSRLDVGAGAEDARIGGVSAAVGREDWGADGTTGRTSLRAWTTDRWFLYGFAELDQGTVGLPHLTPLSGGFVQPDTSGAIPFDPGLRIDDRTTRRLGAGLAWRGLELEAASVRVEADSVFSLGLETDRSAGAAPGGIRSGFEARARVPLLILDGLEARGHLVQWDTVDGSWPYLPERSYDARLHYRQTFLPTGNFEMLVVAGVRERTGMSTAVRADTVDVTPPTDPDAPAPGSLALQPVPFFQSWYARLQLRIVSLRIFVEWENMTLRPANQDFPDRILPRTRASYGVRWTLRN